MHGVSDLISQICLRLLRSGGGGRVQESFQGRHFKSMCLYTALFICALIWPLLLYTVSGTHYFVEVLFLLSVHCVKLQAFWALRCELLLGVYLGEVKGPVRVPSALKKLSNISSKRQPFFRENKPIKYNDRYHYIIYYSKDLQWMFEYVTFFKMCCSESHPKRTKKNKAWCSVR